MLILRVTNLCSHSPILQNSNSQESTEENPNGESLIEALESIQEEEPSKLSQKQSPVSKHSLDPDRLTDYPRAQSPDRLSPVNGSRRSSISQLSLSAMSESSFTSEGSSLSFDANRQPKKKILKNPHRTRRRSKNRVRWKLPGEGDSDTASLQSFDSMLSTVSEIQGSRAQQSYIESRRNISPIATVGYTPSPGVGSGGRGYYSGPHGTPHSTTSSSLLNVSPLSSNPHVHHLLGGSPTRNPYYVQGAARSVSTSSLPQSLGGRETATSGSDTHQSLSPLTHGSAQPRPVIHSTPISARHQSDSYLARPPPRRDARPTDIDMPLQLSGGSKASSVSALQEQRKGAQFFKYPTGHLSHVATAPGTLTSSTGHATPPGVQGSPATPPLRSPATPTVASPAKPTTGSPATPSIWSPGMLSPAATPSIRSPATPSVFLDDDDADDYDHLGPMKSNKSPKHSSPKQHVQEEKKEAVPHEEESAYSEQDIDDALDKIGSDSDDGRSHASTPATTPSSETAPPPPAWTTPTGQGRGREKQKDSQSSPASQDLKQERKHREDLELDEEDGLEDVFLEDIGQLNWQINQASHTSTGSFSAEQEAGQTARGKAQTHLSRDEAGGSTKIAAAGVFAKEDTAFATATRGVFRSAFSARGKDATAIEGNERGNIRAAATGDRAETESASTARTGQRSPDINTSSNRPRKRSPDPPPVPPKPRHFVASREPPPPPLKSGTSSEATAFPLQAASISPASTISTLPSPSHIYLIHDVEEVEDILPPPPEFAFPPTPDDSALSSQEQSTHSDEGLSSVSNTTLVPEQDVAMTETKQVLDTMEQHSAPSSASESPLGSQNKHSWTMIHQSKVKERSGRRDGDEALGVGRKEGEKTASGGSVGMSKRRRSAHPYEDISELPSEKAGNGKGLSAPSLPSYLRRQKMSFEMAITEGNLISHLRTLPPSPPSSQDSPASPLSPSARTGKISFRSTSPKNRDSRKNTAAESRAKNKASNQKPDGGPHGLKRVPNRPAPPPPIPSALTKVSGGLSPDDSKVFQMMSGKPPTMRPIVHDTDRHIQEMLSEIERKESRRPPNTSFYGMCVCTWCVCMCVCVVYVCVYVCVRGVCMCVCVCVCDSETSE